MSGHRYKLTQASVQLGSKPPYNLVNAPTRMHGDMPQVKVDGVWYDYPKDEHRDIGVKSLYGQPIAGIASSWEIDRNWAEESLDRYRKD